MVIGFAILFGLSVFVGWPIGGWLLGGVYAPRKTWPACPRCEYDTGGLKRDAPCPECGLTFEAAWRCLPARTQAHRHWWFILPVTIAGLLIVFGSTVFVGGAYGVACLVPLAYLAYCVLAWNMASTMQRDDKGVLAACWVIALVVSVGTLIALTLPQMRGEDELVHGAMLMAVLVGTFALVPLGGLPVLAAALIIRRRWRLTTKRELAAAPVCPHCAYDRRGLDEREACPECGRAMRDG